MTCYVYYLELFFFREKGGKWSGIIKKTQEKEKGKKKRKNGASRLVQVGRVKETESIGGDPSHETRKRSDATSCRTSLSSGEEGGQRPKGKEQEKSSGTY